MFIAKDSDNAGRPLAEAEELKPSCDVHGGNLFVKLHFKAVKDVPASTELVNTVVTSRDESRAQFSGCGKHLVAVTSSEEDTPLSRQDAVQCIRKYLGTMFGEDVGNSLKDEDIHTIDEKGQEMNADALKKWEDQQKEKGSGKDEESVDESIPSFGAFMLDEAGEAESAPEEDEDEEAPEKTGGEQAPEEEEDEEAPEKTGGELAPEEEEDEEAPEEEIPPPATYLTCYMIKADGLPEEDHTDPKTVESLSAKGKLRLPGSKFNLGIEFGTIGGGQTDTLDLKKLGRELKGKIDADKLDHTIGDIFKKNFPQVPVIERGVRDARTLVDELKIMKFQEDDTEVRAAIQRVGNTRYSFYIQIKDNPAEPYVKKKDIIDMVNASLKQIGGRWLKFMSGVGEKDVIELHATTIIGANTKADREMVFRAVPEPEQVKNIIDGPNQRYMRDQGTFDAPKVWSDMATRFKSLRDKNHKYDDHIIKKIIDVWVKFQKQYNNKPDDVTYDKFMDFYKEYKKAYDGLGIRDRLDESFLSERALMNELFGDIYEDEDSEFDEDAEGDVDSPGPRGDVGDDIETQDGEGGGDDSDFPAKIFILPMKHLDTAFSGEDY